MSKYSWEHLYEQRGLLTPVQITSFEETLRDVTPPSAGEEEETTWDLRLGGRAEPHREDTNCYLLLLT